MIAKRIIPCLDIAHGKVVKGVRFEGVKEIDDPITLSKRYSDEGADELVFYDIMASVENRSLFLDVVSKVALEINIPFMVGGGIRTLEDMHACLKAGADKISVNSAAIDNPLLIQQGAQRFGSQCIVLSMDVFVEDNGFARVMKKGGHEATDLEAFAWARQGIELGAGEIVLNVINQDGTKEGFNISLTSAFAKEFNVPIIASGGAGNAQHMADVLQAGADAALAASIFHFKEVSIKEVKEYSRKVGCIIR
ncbi:MAG: imidazole glycerol phosphate synthase subunit HisF [Erysipelothrix sp.]|jgi:cyclase|nr:imidazole glycerol phosphate synthase subunit HisF [Erysipelothrix sp.]